MNSTRLFVFDMDGVLVASEKIWLEEESTMLEEMFGKEIVSRFGDTIGISVGGIYEKARELGARISKAAFYLRYNDAAKRVYARCAISTGTDALIDYLVAHDWRLALLSASPMLWIEQVLVRLPWRDKLAAVLSLNEHKELRPKPAPDGYQFLLKELGASPKASVALEDSNPGIASAKAASFFTIGYREHLPHGYAQEGANVVAETMQDVLTIVSRDTIAP